MRTLTNGISRYFSNNTCELAVLPFINKYNSNSICKILANSKMFNPKDIIHNFNHEDEEVRKSTIYYVGTSPLKVGYIDYFVKAMQDENPCIIHATIQATVGARHY